METKRARTSPASTKLQTMNSNLSNITNEIKEVGQKIESTFGHLSAAQINWKPDADGWSIGQCFEHLIKTNSHFFPELDNISKGGRKNSLWENYSPLSSFFGNLLVRALKKDALKYKVPSPKIVPPSKIDGNIIELFAAHQSEIIEKIKQTENVDWRKTVITSPFMKLMTYRLADAYRSIVEHERRHFRQAERVLQAENFPKE